MNRTCKDIDQRIWQDTKGHVLTLIHTADKELTIHDLNNGATYRYTQDATRVHPQPVDAPDIRPVGAQ